VPSNYKRKPINIWLCIATVIVINIFVAIFEHPFPIWSLVGDVVMIFVVWEYNRDLKKQEDDDEVVEDERTIENRKKYNRIFLFWIMIFVIAALGVMAVLGIKSVSIEDMILALCILLLGGFTLTSYLSRKNKNPVT